MTQPLLPKRLQRYSTIGVVAPSSPPSSQEKLERGIRYLEGCGFRVLRGESLFCSNGYLAGPDDLRANDVNVMFANDDVDAVICSRGGYGVSRILPLIDFDLIRSHPKIFVGYSDVTALSMALLRRIGLVTFAGPMVAADMQAGMDPFTESALWNILTRPQRHRKIPFKDISSVRTVRAGSEKGKLIGGNLTLLTTLIGTPYEPDWRDAILCLEDVGEPVYKIDRMLAHLLNAGILRSVAGVILGQFTEIPRTVPSRELDDVLADYMLPLGVPVMSGVPFGHTYPKMTLAFGAMVEMNASRKTLAIDGPVVR